MPVLLQLGCLHTLFRRGSFSSYTPTPLIGLKGGLFLPVRVEAYGYEGHGSNDVAVFSTSL